MRRPCIGFFALLPLPGGASEGGRDDGTTAERSGSSGRCAGRAATWPSGGVPLVLEAFVQSMANAQIRVTTGTTGQVRRAQRRKAGACGGVGAEYGRDSRDQGSRS